MAPSHSVGNGRQINSAWVLIQVVVLQLRKSFRQGPLGELGRDVSHVQARDANHLVGGSSGKPELFFSALNRNCSAAGDTHCDRAGPDSGGLQHCDGLVTEGGPVAAGVEKT